jgi:HNH endonuclease
MDFTKAGKRIVLDENSAAHGGQAACEICGEPLVPATQSRTAVSPARNEARVDHMDAKANGGSGDPSNGQGLCFECNGDKSDANMWDLWEQMGTLPNGGVPGPA